MGWVGAASSGRTSANIRLWSLQGGRGWAGSWRCCYCCMLFMRTVLVAQRLLATIERCLAMELKLDEETMDARDLPGPTHGRHGSPGAGWLRPEPVLAKLLPGGGG